MKTAEQKIIPLETETKPRRVKSPLVKQRFRILEHPNRGGSLSYRIDGIKRDGTRVRENHADLAFARQRQAELESEYHSRINIGADHRATKLSDAQLRIAEACFARLDSDDDMYHATEHWLKHGRLRAAEESLRVDAAREKFQSWLDGKNIEGDKCTLRELSRGAFGRRIERFANHIGNFKVNEITPDVVRKFLETLGPVSGVTKDNYRRDISGFFSFCIERRWASVNPCKEIHVKKAEKGAPEILTVERCEKLLRAAEPAKLAAYTAVCLFGGLRPFEASRLTWEQVNLRDKEIRLEPQQTKTGRARVVSICETLLAWLKEYEGQSFFPSGWHKQFRKVKHKAGITAWPVDVMRHTAISHYFRKTGSYGLTAEQFGNSEAIIKAHYQGRVNSDDAKKFYALRPK